MVSTNSPIQVTNVVPQTTNVVPQVTNVVPQTTNIVPKYKNNLTKIKIKKSKQTKKNKIEPIQLFNKLRINLLIEYLNTKNTHACMVLHNSILVFQYGEITKRKRVASVRKSILSILYGMYNIDLNKTLEELNIDDIDVLSSNEKKATVKHLLTARSGVYHAPSNGYGKTEPNKPQRGSHEAGKYWYYNNWDFNVAGTIFEQETKVNIYDALYILGSKLKFDDYNLEDVEKHKQQRIQNTNTTSKHQPYHLYLSARDMSKIGLLMLNKGKYGKEQIISKQWIKKITSLVTPYEEVMDTFTDGLNGYGYMWWVYDTKNKNDPFYGSYSAQGVDEESITIIPKLNIIIVTKGGENADYNLINDKFFTKLVVSAYQK
jgi:hypothetical protein